MAAHEISLVDSVKATPEGRDRLATERALFRVTEQIEELMERQNLSRADLARLTGKSKPWVTQLLDGENNKTIRTVAYVYSLLGAQYESGYSLYGALPQPITAG